MGFILSFYVEGEGNGVGGSLLCGALGCPVAQVSPAWDDPLAQGRGSIGVMKCVGAVACPGLDLRGRPDDAVGGW